MYIKSSRWLMYALLALMITFFGAFGLALSQLPGATTDIQPIVLLPSLIISTGMFLFCVRRAVGFRH
tara:strand:+ start:1190 stop:1390 length:201 start_codon:yes stop_codon:yes gene_type:complete